MQLAGAPSVLSPRRNVAKRNDLHKRPCNPASRPCVDGPFVKNCGRLSASPFRKCYIAEASVLIPQFGVVVNVHVKWVPRRAHPHASQKIRASPSRIPPETLFIFFLQDAWPTAQMAWHLSLPAFWYGLVHASKHPASRPKPSCTTS